MQLIFKNKEIIDITHSSVLIKYLSNLPYPEYKYVTLKVNDNYYIKAIALGFDKYSLEYHSFTGENFKSIRKDFSFNEINNIFIKFFNDKDNWESEIAWNLDGIYKAGQEKSFLEKYCLTSKRNRILVKILSLLFITYALFHIGYKSYMYADWKETQAKIIEIRRDYKFREYPVFIFKESGKYIKVEGDRKPIFDITFGKEYTVGNYISIIYPTNSPEEAIIHNFENKWSGDILTLIVAIFVLIDVIRVEKALSSGKGKEMFDKVNKI